MNEKTTYETGMAAPNSRSSTFILQFRSKYPFSKLQGQGNPSSEKRKSQVFQRSDVDNLPQSSMIGLPIILYQRKTKLALSQAHTVYSRGFFINRIAGTSASTYVMTLALCFLKEVYRKPLVLVLPDQSLGRGKLLQLTFSFYAVLERATLTLQTGKPDLVLIEEKVQ